MPPFIQRVGTLFFAPCPLRFLHQLNPIAIKKQMARLRPSPDHGILQLDNNTAKRTIAIGRKNYLLVGSQTGKKAATIAYTLVETAKLNGIARQIWI